MGEVVRFKPPKGLRGLTALHEKRRQAAKGGTEAHPLAKLIWDDLTHEALRALAEAQCTEREAAACFGVAISTFHAWLDRTPEAKQVWDDGLALGHMSLRRAQYRAAIAGDRTMLIWLGKQWLGQKDEVIREVNMTVKNENAVSDLKKELEAERQRTAPRTALPAPTAPVPEPTHILERDSATGPKPTLN